MGSNPTLSAIIFLYVDIVLPTIEGREIWLRRISRVKEEQQKIRYQLQLQLPERLEPIQIQKCSADSAIA